MSLKLKFQLAIVFMISIVTIVTVQITKSIYTADKLTSVYEKATLEQEGLKNQIYFLKELAEAKALRYTEFYLNNKSRKSELESQFLRDPLLAGLRATDTSGPLLNLYKDQEESIIKDCTSKTFKDLICHNFKSGKINISIAFDVSDVRRKLSRIADLSTFLIMNSNLSPGIPDEVSSGLDLITEGASTYQTDSFLVSSLKSKDIGVQLVSIMEKSRAFKEIEELTKKIFFAALIIGTSCLIFGILLANGITGKLKDLTEYALRIATGDFSEDFMVSGKDEVSTLGRAFGKMRKDLIFFIDEQKTKVRMQHELEVAQVVQRSFFGVNRSASKELKVINQIHPSSECGGDWCFVEHLKFGTLFGIGDATGHGAGAALTTAAVFSGTKILTNLYKDKDLTEEDLKDAIRTLNLVLNMPEQGQLMTFVLAWAPKDREELLVINQGHHSPLLTDPKTGAIAALPLVPSNRLGESLDISPQVQKHPFNKGQLCILITDGLVELKKSEHLRFNKSRLIREISDSKYQNAEQIASYLETKIKQVMELHLNEDDICYVIAERG